MSFTEAGPPSAFSSPAKFMSIPRISSLTLSPSGTRLVAEIAQLDEAGAKFVSSLWELDPDGARPARRLTRAEEGEGGAQFLPDDSLLFVSRRPAAASGSPGEQGGDEAALWLLPAAGGEPWAVARRPGGVVAAVTGRRTSTVIVAAKSAPGRRDEAEDASWWTTRRDQKVSAVLYESLPVRHWDHYLGPDEVHLYAADLSEPGQTAPAGLRDLTPDAGQALHESHPVLSPDGALVAVDWMVQMAHGRSRYELVGVDVATGERRRLAGTDDGSFEYAHPAFSDDGRHLACLRSSRATTSEPPVVDVWVLDLADLSGRAFALGDGPYPTAVCFRADGAGLFVSADFEGRAPLFGVDLDDGTVRRLTGEGAWSSIQVAAGGDAVFALHASPELPPRPTRLGLGGNGAGGDATALDVPGGLGALPGRLEEVRATAADGTSLRAWLVLPDGADARSPAPFVLFVHGGPVSSWNTWHWRWNPWLLAARGWAVLLPDPALSTGYGQQMIRRGWGQWGGAPFEDLMTLTDAALARDDIDSARTAAMGGSYGGYMANWIAGHTDRFSAIVSHASLWSLEQFAGTTDWPAEWADEWGYPDTNPEFYERWSPDRAVDQITTPMLLIHGDRDYRCPVGESLRLWSELVRRGVESKFLWFGDENHWVLHPADAAVWYETVFAFLDEHVRGEAWRRPEGL